MDGELRFLQSEKKEAVFGGGRFSFKVDKIPLNKDAFLEALKDAQENVKTRGEKKKQPEKSNSSIKNEEDVKPQVRTRKKRVES